RAYDRRTADGSRARYQSARMKRPRNMKDQIAIPALIRHLHKRIEEFFDEHEPKKFESIDELTRTLFRVPVPRALREGETMKLSKTSKTRPARPAPRLWWTN